MKLKKSLDFKGYVTPDERYALRKVTILHAYPYWSLEDKETNSERKFSSKKEAVGYLSKSI